MKQIGDASYKDVIKKLNAYPHIQNKLELYWGYAECRLFIEDLKLSDRAGRKGFSIEVLVALDELLELHDTLYPKYKPAPNPWDL